MIFGVHINQILTNVQKQFSISILNVLSVVMFFFDFLELFWSRHKFLHCALVKRYGDYARLGGFCLVIELNQEVSATNGAKTSSFVLCNYLCYII